MPNSPNTQSINGIVHDHSSIVIRLDTTRYVQIESISFKDELTPGELNGASAMVLGTSRGKYKANGSLKMSQADSDYLIERLGPGFMLVKFPIFVTWSDPGTKPSTRLLQGVRILSNDETSEGDNPAMVSHDLWITKIIRNGIDPLGKPGNIGTGTPL
jgi:hypothetical protein